MTRFLFSILLTVVLTQPICAATAVATYQFNNTLAADEAGAPALVPTDPLAASGFVADNVFGVNQQVWSYHGNENPTNQQAGLTLNTTGLVAPTSYSVDIVFLFTQRQNAWRRIIDVEDRQSDNGFYVNPSNNLDIYPVSGSTAAWTNGVYHHVVVTNNGTTVNTYLDGVGQFTTSTALLNINNANNPGLLMGFFLDNVIAGGQFEFSDGRVALIRLWNGVLDPLQARQIASPSYLPGDYNHNGSVGPEDYTVWTTDFDSLSKFDADGNGNFTVDAADYTVWRDHLGTHLGTGSAASVPEPSAALLALSASSALVFQFVRQACVKTRLLVATINCLRVLRKNSAS
jgi:hypothetical protein